MVYFATLWQPGPHGPKRAGRTSENEWHYPFDSVADAFSSFRAKELPQLDDRREMRRQREGRVVPLRHSPAAQSRRVRPRRW